MSTSTAAPPTGLLNTPEQGFVVMTSDVYEAFEQTADERHEFWNGKVIPVAGGTPEHNLLGSNLLRVLADASDNAGLSHNVYGSDQRVYVSDAVRCYPDVTVADDPAQFDSHGSLRNPLLLVEVLSHSTAGYDLGEKWEQYRTIPSLRHYLVVEQKRISVTHYEKIAGNLWAIVGTHTTLGDTVTVTLGETLLTIPVARIYARVALDKD